MVKATSTSSLEQLALWYLFGESLHHSKSRRGVYSVHLPLPFGVIESSPVSSQSSSESWLCVSHPRFYGADFCGEGTGHFRSSGEQVWKSIWNEHKLKLLRAVVGPISTPNYFWNWAAETTASHGTHGKSFRLVTILSLRVKSFLFLQDMTRKEYAVCRSPGEVETYSPG